jgi:hypothetical protein
MLARRGIRCAIQQNGPHARTCLAPRPHDKKNLNLRCFAPFLFHQQMDEGKKNLLFESRLLPLYRICFRLAFDAPTGPGACAMTAPHEQKLRVTGPVIVTANRLGDGAVIYRTRGGEWSIDLDDAAVVTTAAAATEMLGASSQDGLSAVGAYVAPVRFATDGRLEPGNLRERIRRAGPTFELPIGLGC